MLLSALEPQLLRIVIPGKEYHHVDTLAEAQGVMCLCPGCFAKNGGPVGTHTILCWFRDKGVPHDLSPGPARWVVSGTGLADITLSPSVLLLSGCGWHGFIEAGQVRTC